MERNTELLLHPLRIASGAGLNLCNTCALAQVVSGVETLEASRIPVNPELSELYAQLGKRLLAMAQSA